MMTQYDFYARLEPDEQRWADDACLFWESCYDEYPHKESLFEEMFIDMSGVVCEEALIYDENGEANVELPYELEFSMEVLKRQWLSSKFPKRCFIEMYKQWYSWDLLTQSQSLVLNIGSGQVPTSYPYFDNGYGNIKDT